MPSERVNFYNLGKDIKSIVDEVVAKFKDMDTNEIVEYMHDEKEYHNTKMGEVMRFGNLINCIWKSEFDRCYD